MLNKVAREALFGNGFVLFLSPFPKSAHAEILAGGYLVSFSSLVIIPLRKNIANGNVF